MADESKEVVLKFTGDVTNLLKSITTAEDATRRMQTTLGQQGKAVSQILGKSFSNFQQVSTVDAQGQLKNFGNEIGQTSTKVKLANGTIGTYTETAKRMTDGNIKVVGSFKEASLATESYGEAMGRLLKRALITIPVWMLLRTVLTGTIKLFKSSIKFLIDWEYQMAQIAIVGNATKATLSVLSSALLQLGKDFGISIKDLGEASKLWAQQGRAMEEIIPLMRATAQLSLLTGQTTVQSVEDLTAITKAYGIEAKDTITIIDSMTNVMLKHAITAGDLASAYKQVASTASSLGVSFDELTGYITAIRTVTRDSGNKIGLSLRTMFSRITTSSAEAIQQLSSVPLYLDNTGKATFAVTPRMRALGDIISELSLKFGTLGNAQKSQLANLVGGVRRQNQVFALFDNFTESVQAQTDSIFGLGKSSSAIAILTDTAKIGIDKLKNSWASFVDSVANSEVIKNVINGLTSAVEVLDKVLAPDKFDYKNTLNGLNKQNDAYSRQRKYLDGINALIIQSEQLEGQRTRATVEQAKIIDDQANIYRKAFNEASKVAGIDFKVSSEGGLGGLVEELQAVSEEAKELNLQALVGQQIVAIKTEALSTGQTLGQMIDQFNQFTSRKASTRFTFEEQGLAPIRKESRELFNTIVNLSSLVKQGLTIPNEAIDKFVNLTKTYGNFSKEDQALLENLLSSYQQKNGLLEDEGKIREGVIKQLDTVKNFEQDIVLEYEKQNQIAKLILEDQLERLKANGALNSEVLKAEGLLKKQLKIEEQLEDRVKRQLALQREKTKEQRLQSKLGSDSIKLFEIAQTEGTDIAKAIGDVLAGDTSFSSFVQRGGKALEVFKQQFEDIFKQQQALAFFGGGRVPGLEGLQGGRRINIEERGIFEPVSRFNVQAELQKQRILEQEQNAIIGRPATQTQVDVDMPVNVNVDVGSIDEIGEAVTDKLAKEIPQVGSKINKAITATLFNKQTRLV